MQSPQPSPALRRIARGDLCAGCGACGGMFPDKIGVEMAPPGFLRPRQRAPLTAEEEDSFSRFCPALGQKVEARGRTDHVLWGPYLKMRTGWATDPELRFSGASGGALSGVLLHLLESGEIEAVVQIAADPENPIANRTVISTDRAGILAAAGSRYAPSAPLARLSELVATGKRHAFVGKPCDVAALRVLSAERPEVAAAFPVLLSFFCAGVPSETGARAVLAALGTGPDEVTRFRYRGQGWPGRATARLSDGSERSMSYHDSWGGILSNHVQHRCKICADGTGKAADLVCADAWESDARGYPVFDEAEGVSLVVSRTALGARILQEAIAAGRIETAPFDVGELAAIQPGQRERRRALLARLLALRLAGQPVPHYAGLHLWQAARENPILRNLKNFLGMARRVLRRRMTGRG
ncbi:Coenzyme F420 hydrogenase/dehydrogenase, beta subunit C-terminal domain [Roseovarius autotrophicus]|uniref:Coenzyme F420 hydrogenase/dehydrogenase, beta subunit C-terminal domain n=1 Tax=Roseovarius autotrophicus TaxID=2824121 RepID=UPI001FFCDF87|nr:Coenzyme F420 hydrogenase/dehydrogenase, beta subunit C-terminal domain [Roseovarius autotrophicus]